MLFNHHRYRHATERSRRVPWASVALYVITVYCVYVKGTVTDMYRTGNCDNVVPVFPPVGAREYLSKVLLCWGVDQRSGHDAPAWYVIVTLCISVVIM